MSKVRMCDVATCGKIFPEGEEGSSHYSGTVNRQYQDGSRYQQQEDRDMCPACAGLITGKRPVPMPVLEGTEMPVQ